MVIEAFDNKGNKYKVGQEIQVNNKKGWIFDILIDDATGKMSQLFLLGSGLDEYFFASPSNKITFTGKYEPDILKLKRKLAK